MRRLLTGCLVTASVVAGFGLFVERTTSAQGQVGPPEITPPAHHDQSRPLREIPPRRDPGPRREFPVGRIPPMGVGSPDTAVQSSVVSGLAIAQGIGFDGVGEGVGGDPFDVQYAPPDINGAAGLTQYVQWVNTSFAVFDKATGAVLYGPAAGNTIWAGFGGGCENNNDGDPIVQYDKAANRWVMTQFSVSTTPYLQCVAVSQTSDAMGSWNRYAYAYSQFPDYPKLTVWPDAYYISFNMFSKTGPFFSFAGGRACAYNRAAMIAGTVANQVCFQLSSSFGGLLPSDLDGSTPPPAGTPNFFLSTNSSTSSLLLWKFAVNWSGSGSGTLTGPTSIPVAGFTLAVCGNSLACVPQLGTSQKLDTLGDRLMYRLAYRNFGTHESLVVNHAVNINSTTGVRWYEIRSPNGTPVVYQQSTYTPDSKYRWMGSVAMDKVGNMVLGYSVSSSAMHPAIRFAGREVTDPLSQLAIETSIIEGAGSQTTNLSRWGDYSSMSVDPTDDCTFWYTNQYQKTNGTFNWSTRINSFSYPSCTGSSQADFSIGAAPSSQTIVQGGSTEYTVTVTPSGTFTGSVALSVTGLPTGATGTFTPSSISDGSGSSTLAITTDSTTPAGTFTLTITGQSGALSHSTTVTLVVNTPVAPDFSISASPSSQTVTQGGSTDYTATVTATGGFASDVVLSVSGLPDGATGIFNPTTIAGGGGTSTLTVTTNATTPAGTFTLTITGQTATLSHATTVTLIVNAPVSGDFSLSGSPGMRNVRAGQSTTYTVTINRTGGFSDAVALSLSGAAGVSGIFDPNPASGTSSSLAVTTASNVPAGNYALTITGTNGSLVRTTTVNLRIR